jgi:SWI/SNF-related matrix-associated actin-dependent regulator 1 of chromatin subfamily A
MGVVRYKNHKLKIIPFDKDLKSLRVFLRECKEKHNTPYKRISKIMYIYSVIPTGRIIRFLRDNNYQIEGSAESLFSEVKRNQKIEIGVKGDIVNRLLRGIGGAETESPIEINAKRLGVDFNIFNPLNLYEYQKEGILYLLADNKNVLVADAPGLGKTITIASYLRLSNAYPALIITPASVKLNWEYELKKWTGQNVLTLRGMNTWDISPYLSTYPLVCINYDILCKKKEEMIEVTRKGKVEYKAKCILSGWLDEIVKCDFKTIICDESHYLSTVDSARTLGVVRIMKTLGKARRLCLSGTPYNSKPKQLYTTLNLINKSIFSNRWFFLNRYCGAKHNGFGWTFNGASHTDELYNKMKPFTIRRLKKDVLKQLPLKVKAVVPIDVDNKSHDTYMNYEALLFNNIGYTESSTTETYHELRKKAVSIKYKGCIAWIKDYLEVSEKLVVFCYHRAIYDSLMADFKDISVGINGSVKSDKRQGIIDKFQKDNDTRLFIGQIKAAGVGITLTAANAVCFVEFGDTCSEHEQAEDRINRIGQEADSITAYYLIAPNTIEDSIMDRIKAGYAIQKRILDNEAGVNFMDFDNDLIKGSVQLRLALVNQKRKQTELI